MTNNFPTYCGGSGSGGSGGGIASYPVSATRPFADVQARDTWAAAHKDELIQVGTVVSVAPDKWFIYTGETAPATYDASKWLDADAIVRGPAGKDGKDGTGAGLPDQGVFDIGHGKVIDLTEGTYYVQDFDDTQEMPDNMTDKVGLLTVRTGFDQGNGMQLLYLTANGNLYSRLHLAGGWDDWQHFNAGSFSGLFDHVNTSIDADTKIITLQFAHNNVAVQTENIDISAMFHNGGTPPPPPVDYSIYYGFSDTNVITDVIAKAGSTSSINHLDGHNLNFTRGESSQKYLFAWIPDALGTATGFKTGGFSDVWASTALDVDGVAGKFYVSDNTTGAQSVTYEVEG